ncbi:MAG TPA: HD domain-containing protein [Desulfomicrobiaceae bacterium]|nr:HD domain-containing protein [Desulfomicrobiaceae bacterium]
MPSVRKGLLQLVFSGASMKRWNDKLRPMELVEVDKQAHKMITAWMLFQLNSGSLGPESKLALGEAIVRGGMYEYLYRLVITDIKPPIFYQIKANPAHYQQLTRWVLDQLHPWVQPLGADFRDGLSAHFTSDPGTPEELLAGRILHAAHMFASQWEFHLLRELNRNDEEMEEIEANFNRNLSDHRDLHGVTELMAGPSSPLGRFGQLVGRLRFQKRWSQTPRIPETSVLGHMFIVACYGYFFSIAVGACPARRQNNFFAGLFHDLPELLTRDIISPVKSSVRRIGDLIKEYEYREMERKVFSPLAGRYDTLVERLNYYLGAEIGSEFDAAIISQGTTRSVTWDQIQGEYNADRFDPKDGFMLKVCDSLAAFIEAYTATRNGITNDQLQQALWRIRGEYQNASFGDGLHIGALLADFD